MKAMDDRAAIFQQRPFAGGSRRRWRAGRHFVVDAVLVAHGGFAGTSEEAKPCFGGC
jgi:hypothetical protein